MDTRWWHDPSLQVLESTAVVKVPVLEAKMLPWLFGTGPNRYEVNAPPKFGQGGKYHDQFLMMEWIRSTCSPNSEIGLSASDERAQHSSESHRRASSRGSLLDSKLLQSFL